MLGTGIEYEQNYSAVPYAQAPQAPGLGSGEVHGALLTVLRLTPPSTYLSMTCLFIIDKLDRVGPELVELPQALLPSRDSSV